MKLGHYKALCFFLQTKLLEMIVFQLCSQNNFQELLQIAYVNRKLCTLSNAKDCRSKKFSFYLISRIDGVEMCKNFFKAIS